MWPRLLLLCGLAASVGGMQVVVKNKWNVAMLFQYVTLRCEYTTSMPNEDPIIMWKYKSYCRDRVSDAFNPSSGSVSLNTQVQQANPNYNPYTDCPDTQRIVRTVATKRGTTVTLGSDYQARRITIINQAELEIQMTQWGDSGVYYCQVISTSDLTGNNEAYGELLVLSKTSNSTELLPGFDLPNLSDWLFVVLIVMGGVLLLILIGVCWCQCCPHTCCCYVSCVCCPERCCCPRALYEAGKAATGSYAGSTRAPSVFSRFSTRYGRTHSPAPRGYPLHNEYHDNGSSVGISSNAPLLHREQMEYSSAESDDASNVEGGTWRWRGRPAYRVQAEPSGNGHALYRVETELQAFNPTRPDPLETMTGMTELSSLHDDDRGDLRDALRRARERALPPVRDIDMSPPSSRRSDRPSRDGEGRRRAHSVDDLDDVGLPGPGHRSRDYSPERRDDYYYYQGKHKSRSRDDLRNTDWEPRGDPNPRRDPRGDSYPREDPRGDPRDSRGDSYPRSNNSRGSNPRPNNYGNERRNDVHRNDDPRNDRGWREEAMPPPPKYSDVPGGDGRYDERILNAALGEKRSRSREDLVGSGARGGGGGGSSGVGGGGSSSGGGAGPPSYHSDDAGSGLSAAYGKNINRDKDSDNKRKKNNILSRESLRV